MKRLLLLYGCIIVVVCLNQKGFPTALAETTSSSGKSSWFWADDSPKKVPTGKEEEGTSKPRQPKQLLTIEVKTDEPMAKKIPIEVSAVKIDVGRERYNGFVALLEGAFESLGCVPLQEGGYVWDTVELSDGTFGRRELSRRDFNYYGRFDTLMDCIIHEDAKKKKGGGVHRGILLISYYNTHISNSCTMYSSRGGRLGHLLGCIGEWKDWMLFVPSRQEPVVYIKHLKFLLPSNAPQDFWKEQQPLIPNVPSHQIHKERRKISYKKQATLALHSLKFADLCTSLSLVGSACENEMSFEIFDWFDDILIPLSTFLAVLASYAILFTTIYTMWPILLIALFGFLFILVWTALTIDLTSIRLPH